MASRSCLVCGAAMGTSLRCRACGAGDPRSRETRRADRLRVAIAVGFAATLGGMFVVAVLVLGH